MTDFTHLWLVFVMVLGIIAGGICHTVAGALGVGLLFKLVPGLTDVMLVAGALYIAWIGISLLRSQPTASADSGPVAAPARTDRATFQQALLTCLLNPKAYLFMLAVFPQFLRAEYGPVWLQAVALGSIIALTQWVIYGGLVLVAGSAQRTLGQQPATGVLVARLAGAALIAGAIVTVVGVIRAH